MTTPVQIKFTESDKKAVASLEGGIAVLADPSGRLDPMARTVNRLARGAVARFVESLAFNDLKIGQAKVLAYPAELAAEYVAVVKLPRRSAAEEARKAGAALAKAASGKKLTVLAGTHPRAAEISYGIALREYRFDSHKTGEEKPHLQDVTLMVSRPEQVSKSAGDMAAMVEAVFFTRDLVNEPSNVLTTGDFAARLAAMQEIGLNVEVLEEDDLEELGMRALLGVGQGSRSPTKVVVMEWKGGGDEAPFALVGKGVVFDAGGISLKPAQGMEEMTMDMGGAGVVAGTMRGLALRRAKANVVGIVGLVENMPDGNAQRPGDVVKSMKGDTIEIVNTDAEGRLVLADILWYAQERFKPSAMINLATLTGAIIISLGHEKAGVFSNDDAFCNAFLKAAQAEGEGAWRMPLAPAYDELLKSRIADVSNVGGRPAGSITAAQFLKRFVKDETPWIHLDIAGVARLKKDSDLAPKGATGWGVRSLDRLIRDRYQT
ncbi:MAG: leucyl aminopeptidase [Paracoccaceae bacterium]